MSFTIKSFTLVASIIAFLIFIYINSSFSESVDEQEEQDSFELQAKEDLNKLISRADCLSYSVDGVAQKGVLDASKLDAFGSEYKDSEPLCALEEDFDYNITVIEDPVNLTIYSKFSGDIEFLPNEINHKNTIFLMDVSASMLEPCGTFNAEPIDKISCIEIFMESFIEQLADDSQIALFIYPQNKWVFEMTKVGGNEESLKSQASFTTEKGTPMCVALEEAYSYLDDVDVDRIVLLTDGCENSKECWIGDSVKVVKTYLGRSPPVHTIAFGEDVEKCTYLLEEISNLTGGVYFRAETCEELAGRTPQYNIETEGDTWEFGVEEYSPSKVIENQITITQPVTIRHNETTYLSGTIIMYAASGELELIASKIEKVCNDENKNKVSLEMTVTYPLKYENGQLCINSDESICKTISCPYPIQFEEIENSGQKLITIEHSEGEVVVKT